MSALGSDSEPAAAPSPLQLTGALPLIRPFPAPEQMTLTPATGLLDRHTFPVHGFPCVVFNCLRFSLLLSRGDKSQGLGDIIIPQK